MSYKLLFVGVLFLFLIGSVHANLTDDLVSYYKLDGTTGAVIDSHGSNDGTNYGATRGVTGIINNAFDFDGTNDFVSFGFNSLPSGSTRTFNFWFNVNDISGGTTFSDTNPRTLWVNSTDRETSQIRILGSGIDVAIKSSDTYYETRTNQDIISVDTWYNLIVIIEPNENVKLYLNGELLSNAVKNDTTPSTWNESTTSIMGGITGVTNNRYFNGTIDEVGIWSRALTSSEIEELYNSGSGLTYPFSDSVNANFDYTIDKENEQVILEDTSTTFGAVSITDWNWSVNNTLVSNLQDYNYSTTELQDLNVCLFVDTNTTDVNDTKCYAFNTGDWSPPTTTFSSEQVTGTTDANITLSCTDDNSGCKAINYNVNNERWNTINILENYFNSNEYGCSDCNPSLTHTYNLFNVNNDLNGVYINNINAIHQGRGTYTGGNLTLYLKYIYFDGTNSNSETKTMTYNELNKSEAITFTTLPVKRVYSIEVWTGSAPTGYYRGSYIRDININYSDSNFSNSHSFIYSDVGDHNIQYFSTDNADNNETIKTSTFTTYGLANFTFYDEDTEALLNDVVWTVSPSIGGVSGGTLTDTNTLDLNLQGITSQEYTFTFSKENYGTRTYQTNLNQYSDINTNFALLETNLSTNIPFKIYQTDETTLYTNTIVELYKPDNNFVIGRKKTNETGNVTFNIHISDQNYHININEGEYTYQPVALTIHHPKNEETLEPIEENWKIEITQNLYETYTDLTTDRIIYLLPNTAEPFNIRISDMNGNYFSRTYAQQYLGDPRTAEIQPYLVSTATGLLTTITTKDATTNINLPNVTIKIYKFISGEGRTLVEQVITDAKGQAITLLIAGAEYSFETYYEGKLIKTFNITSTSTTIYILLDIGIIEEDTPPTGYTVKFIPTGTGLLRQTTGTINLQQTINNISKKNTTYTSRIIINNTIISEQTHTGTDQTKNFTHTINWTDITGTTITSRMIITEGTKTYTFNQTYNITSFFDTNYNIIQGLSTGLRQDAQCQTEGLCYPLLVIAIFACIGLVIMASVTMGQFGTQSIALVFLVGMIFFTYLTWVPFEITVIITILTLAFIINERGV